MAVLGAEFSMSMLCSCAASDFDTLATELHQVAGELDMQIVLKPTQARQPGETSVPLRLSLRGMDNEGLVHEVVRKLVAGGIAVDHLDSHVVNAPWFGVPLFEMDMQLRAPASFSLSSLRQQMTALANELNVDIEVHAPSRSGAR